MILLVAPFLDPGLDYVALPGAALLDEEGRPMPSERFVFHRLRLKGIGANGSFGFLLDGDRRVQTSAKRPEGMRRIVPSRESDRVRELRRRYVGRPLWTFGPYDAIRQASRPVATGYWSVGPGQTMRIGAIYQIDRSLPDAHDPIGVVGPDWVVVDAPKDVTDWRPPEPPNDGFFLIAPQMPKGRFVSWSPTVPRSDRVAERAYGPPYGFIDGSWLFERVFSLVPPSTKDLKAIHRAGGMPYGEEGYLRGLTHLQVAWYAGWPRYWSGKGPSALLKERNWMLHGNEYLGFKNDRVVSFVRGLPY